MEKTIQKHPAIDAHLDLGMYVRQERQRGRRQVLRETYLQDMRTGGLQAVVAAIFVDEKTEPGSALEQACGQIAALLADIAEAPEAFALCVSSAEITQANRAGKIAILLSLEGAEPLEKNPELLPFFHRAGVRGLGLAHARRNLSCDGARYTDSPHNLGSGLTDLGVAFIEQAQALRMLIDVSHLNDAGTDDVLSLVKGPVIASHSNCRAVNPTRRNLTDAQIRAIAEHGGVIGLNGCSAIISDRKDADLLRVLMDHADHLKAVGGIDCIGLGFDLAEMILPDSSILVNGSDIPVKDAVPNYTSLIGLAELLHRRGYSDDEVDKIFFGNFSRVYREVLA